MRTKIIFGIVAVELLAIVLILAYIAQVRGVETLVTPFSRDDITSASSSLIYYYDLATEGKTSVPEWLPYEPEYLRNSDQLNDRFDYTVEKPGGTYRIITLGDSWGFGMHVSTKDNYSEGLEDLLNENLAAGTLACRGITKFEVLNLGVGGYDIEYMLERLKLRGMKYDPDLVVPIIKPDDFLLVNEIFQARLRPLYEEYGDLTAKTVDGVARNPRQELSEKVEKEIMGTYTPEELDAYGKKALDSLAAFYDGTVLFFVYGKLSQSQAGILRDFADTRGSAFIFDSIPTLRAEEKAPHDEHPGVSGHARFARELYRYMIEESVIPCDERT
jgi:hypothetical protein